MVYHRWHHYPPKASLKTSNMYAKVGHFWCWLAQGEPCLPEAT
jgi:hypothetical protein